MVPLYAARVEDLRIRCFVGVTCRHCGHLAELAVVRLREKLAPYRFIKHLGPELRCRACHRKGAEVDARGGAWVLRVIARAHYECRYYGASGQGKLAIHDTIISSPRDLSNAAGFSAMKLSEILVSSLTFTPVGRHSSLGCCKTPS